MFYFWYVKLGAGDILNDLKTDSNYLSPSASNIEALTKRCLFFCLCENRASDHLSSYGEIQSEWHEGAPGWAFAPPN